MVRIQQRGWQWLSGQPKAIAAILEIAAAAVF